MAWHGMRGMILHGQPRWVPLGDPPKGGRDGGAGGMPKSRMGRTQLAPYGKRLGIRILTVTFPSQVPRPSCEKGKAACKSRMRKVESEADRLGWSLHLT